MQTAEEVEKDANERNVVGAGEVQPPTAEMEPVRQEEDTKGRGRTEEELAESPESDIQSLMYDLHNYAAQRQTRRRAAQV